MDETKKILDEIIALYEKGQTNEAEALYKELPPEIQENHIILSSIFKIYFFRKEFDKAEEYILKAIKNTNSHYYFKDLGRIYQEKGDYNKAKDCYLKVLKTHPDNPKALYYFGIALFHEGIEESTAYFERVLELDPSHSRCHLNLAMNCQETMEMDKAIEHLVKAINLKKNFGEALLLLGSIFLHISNFAEGWTLCEARFYIKKRIHRIQSSKPIWDGSSLEGKTIFVDKEMGMGDCIMLARFIPVLNAMGAKVLFRPYSSLKQLFKDNDFPAQIIDMSTDVNTLEFDSHITLMSLPGLLKINDTNVPFRDKYLKANPKKAEKYKEKYFQDAKFKIGIAWQCKNLSRRDKLRSIPDLSYLYPLTKIPGVKVYSLQKGKSESQLENLPDGIDIINLGKNFSDFSDTAAAIENLDLVIAVDTSVAHLAGAMGKDTLMLLRHASDWKWLLNRDDTMWYEKMKLFSQKEPNNWIEVIDRVVEYVKKQYKDSF